MSISTAKLVMWLHWQLMWLLFLLSSSHPLEDQPPVPPTLITNTCTADIHVSANEFREQNQLFSCKTVRPAHAKEWFQKTQTGLVLSSVSSRVYSKVMGGSRTGGSGGPSLCTVVLTMAVLITGRLGSLGGGIRWNDQKHNMNICVNMQLIANPVYLHIYRCTIQHKALDSM